MLKKILIALVVIVAIFIIVVAMSIDRLRKRTR